MREKCVLVEEHRCSLTHSVGSDAKLAFPVHQTVLNDSKEARVSICGTDTDYSRVQVRVLKHWLLETQTEKHSVQLLWGVTRQTNQFDNRSNITGSEVTSGLTLVL